MKYSPRITPISHIQDGEALALLKILALGNRQIEERKVVPAAAAISWIRDRTAQR